MHGLLREMEHWRTFIIVIVLLLPCLPGPNSPILHLPELSGIPDHPGVRQSYVRCSRCSLRHREEQVESYHQHKPQMSSSPSPGPDTVDGATELIHMK